MLACGCGNTSLLNLNFETTVEEDIFGRLNSTEAILIRSTLLCGDPNIEGSFSWLEKTLQGELHLNKQLVMGSNAVLLVFFYPSEQFPVNHEPGIIFANVEQVQNSGSGSEFTQWFNIARLPKETIRSQKALCRYVFWLSAHPWNITSERCMVVTEEFELKDGHWHLLRVRRNLAD